MNSLYQKHLLKISDLNLSEINEIINLSILLKRDKNKNQEKKYLINKKIALIFEQESTRTRCSFEIAAFEQGAYTSYLSSKEIHLGYKESIQDTIQVLERMYDGIVYRGKNDNTLNTLSKYSNIPIWNGLTKKYHPTQLLADILTIQENLKHKSISDVLCVYIGDASNNIANTIIEMSNILKFKLHIVAPKEYWPNQDVINYNFINKNKKILLTDNIIEGIRNADFIYTDVWMSLGDSLDELNKKIKLLKKYQVNDQMIKNTNNNNVKVLHCLPALHDQNTVLGKKIAQIFNLNDGIEITNSVFNQNIKIILQQSENKLHTIKALMIKTLKKNI